MANFNPDEYLIKFDPDAYLEESPTITPTPSELESALGGVQQGVSLGWGDELAGLAGAAGSIVGQLGGPSYMSPTEAYQLARDEERARQLELEKANPKSYLGGSVAGGLVIPGKSIGALVGQGALSGAGGQEGGVLKGTLTGGALGGAGGAIGKGLEKGVGAVTTKATPLYDKLVEKLGVKKATDWLETQAGKLAEKAGGFENTKSQREAMATMINKGKIQKGEIGKKLLEEGIVTAGASSKTIADRAFKAKEEVGKEIGAILDRSPNISPEDLRLALIAKAESLQDVGTNKAIKKQLLDIAETYNTTLPPAPLTSSFVREEKSKLGELADWQKPKTDPNVMAYGELDTAIKSGMSPEDLTKYLEANKSYTLLTPAEKAAGKMSAADAGRNILRVGALPAIAIGAGSLQGEPGIGGLAAAGLFGLATKRGASTMAGGIHQANKLITRAPDKFKGVLQNALQKGEKSFAVTQFLLQSNNEEYRNAEQEAKKKEEQEVTE